MWLRITNFKTTKGTFGAAWLSRVLNKEVQFPNHAEPFINIPDFVEGDIEKLFDNGIAAEKDVPPGLIPAHMKAATWMVVVIHGVMMFYVTRDVITSIFGSMFVGLGQFQVDQTAHLKRHQHEVERLTWFERQLVENPVSNTICGVWYIVLGLWLGFYR